MSGLSSVHRSELIPDLILDDGVPEVVCKIARGNHDPFILRVLSGRAFRQAL